MSMDDRVRAVLRETPGLGEWTGPLERMGGLTNMVYPAGPVVVRLPGPGTE
jgi:hypothetical protein